jgi:hypothetical protein
VSGYPLDDVHRLIDGLDDLLRRLNGRGTPDKIPVNELPELIEAIHELDGWRNTTYLQTKVGINGSLLNRFMTLRGSVSSRDAVKIADRLRSYLKSQDQSTVADHAEIAIEGGTAEGVIKAAEQPKPPVLIAEQWVAVSTSAMKMKIAAIASLLDTIVEQIKHSNAPDDEQVLTALERRQLIAILETALNVLKSPIVETGLLKKARDGLKKAAISAAEKHVQQGLGTLMEVAKSRIVDLVKLLLS